MKTNSLQGSKDELPLNRTEPCQYDSCTPAGASYGHDPTNARLNWVNSYPVTSMKYGISMFTPALSGGRYPDLAVSGPNVGPNVGPAIPVSGTIGAASYAAHEAGIPAIAFSGWGNNTAWNATRPLFTKLYARAATRLLNRLVAEGRPFLPKDVWLNVNFPHANETSCSTVNNVKFVLTTMEDVGPTSEACGIARLPTEMSVVLHSGCYASVTVAMAPEKKDASAAVRQVVADRLKGLLGNFPAA